MPELAGTQILAIGSFAALVIAWLMAPSSEPVAVSAKPEAVPAAA